MATYRRKASAKTFEAEQYKEYGKLVKGMCNSMSCFTAGNNKPHVHTIHDGQIANLEVGDFILHEPDGKHYYPVKPDIFADSYEDASEIQAPEIFPIGAFCIDKGDINITDPAMVVYDHTKRGHNNLRTIKFVKSGHLSSRKIDELMNLHPLAFCKEWCKDQISYGKE